MPPKLFQVSDFLLIPIPVLFIVICLVFGIANIISPEEPVSWVGWVVLGLVISSSMAFIVAFYVQRWSWNRCYAYTVWGIAYYYTKGLKPYRIQSVESDLENLENLWKSYSPDVKYKEALRGVTCLFRPEESWIQTVPGWWTRRVTGLTYLNRIEVGTGGRFVCFTAHKHELSHVVLNEHMKRQVPEAQAHEIIMRKVRVV